jgi:hypothetical protein
MPRTTITFSTPDLSAFARALGQAWNERHARGEAPPGHVEMLNLIARAAGHRNVQALRASAKPLLMAEAAEDSPAPTPLTPLARKALEQFDTRGRLVRWPNKFSVQKLAMWVLWTRFEARRLYTESEVNAILKDAQTYGDHVTLRRELINHQLMARKSDCSEYRKLPARPDDETRALLAAWRAMVRDTPRPARVVRDDAPIRRRAAGAASASPAG